ncbi:hypothetical protein LJC59_09850 [Desulfovibrio sp. OttesenSCG-928-A18]|nr:hypothetical protein [Desulfovibrio sp. OttesenSCG-928-A18]
MATIMPQSELLKRAVAFISESRKDAPGTPLGRLLDEAAMRFNLSPVDGAALERLFREEEQDNNNSGTPS